MTSFEDVDDSSDQPWPVMPSDAIILTNEPPPVDEIMITALEQWADSAVDPEDVGGQLADFAIRAGTFALNDPLEADWALRRHFEATVRLDEVRKMYDQFKAGLDAWFERVSGPHRATREFFATQLEDYGRRWRATQPPSRPKTLALPSGKLKTRATQMRAVIVDQDAVLVWAKKNVPEIVKTETKEWVNVSDLRGFVECIVDVDDAAPELITMTKVVAKDSGEIVPGMTVEPEHVSVDVEIPK